MKAYNIGYRRNGIYQAITVIAKSKEHAEQFFRAYKPDAIVYGATAITEKQCDANGNKGIPMIYAK